MWKKIMVHSGLLSVFLFFSFFISLFCSSSPSYAISDYTVTLDWDNISPFYLCGGDSGRNCSDYSYFFSVPSSVCSESAPGLYVSNFNGINVNSIISVCSTIIVPLSNTSSLYVTGGRNLASRYSGDITITLTESFGSAPSGSITLTENGTYDVSSYATAVVDVPAEVIQGDYHNDLVNVVQAIYVCAGVMLVLYFFYCIYRLIIRNSGVK